MLGKLFDVAIIGSELAGLVTGALLVKRGFQVLLIDVESERIQVKRDGYTFAPFPGLFFGFNQGQVFSDIFTELGIPFLEKKRFNLAQPAYQVVLPDIRLDVNQGREELYQLLQSEFSADAASIMSMLGEVDRYSSVVRSLLKQDVVYPAFSLRERWGLNRACGALGADFKEGSRINFSEFLSGFPLSPEGRGFLEAQFRFLSPLYPDDPSLFFGAFVLSWTNKGIFKVEGGIKVLEDICKERISSYRGKLHRTPAIEDIDFGRINEIKLVESKEPARCKKILVSSNIEEFFKRFSPKSMKGSFKEKLELPVNKLHDFTLYVAIDAEVVPVGMDENVILLTDPNRPLSAQNVIYVRLSPIDSPEYAPPGKRLISATTLIQAENEEFGPFQAKKVSDQIYGSLLELIPFLKDFTEYIAYDESYALYKAIRNETVQQSIDPEDRFGIGGLTNRTPHSEVYYAGKRTLPGLGMEGEGISALTAANLLTKVLKK